MSSDAPFPCPIEEVAHSPTPSIVRTAASSKGDGKNADAACDSWCSAKRISPGNASSSRIRSFIQSFSRIQSGIAFRNDRKPRGAKSRYVSKSRSNFRSGLS